MIDSLMETMRFGFWPTVLELVLKAVLLVTAGVGLSFLLRRSPAALRHAIWFAIMVVLVVLPFEVVFGPLELYQVSARPMRGFFAPDLGVAVSLVWLAASGGFLICLLVAVSRLGVLAKGSSEPVTEGRVHEIAQRVALRCGYDGDADLRIATKPGWRMPPMTLGLGRPIVVLPIAALEWTEERIYAVLAHEFAHLRRADWTTQVLSRVACAIHWFNPIVWYAARQLELEAEKSADDCVLREGFSPVVYAEHLVAIARELKGGSMARVPGVALVGPSEIGHRVMAVLDEGRNRRGLGFASILALTALWITSLAPLGMIGRESYSLPADEMTVRPARTWYESRQGEQSIRLETVTPTPMASPSEKARKGTP